MDALPVTVQHRCDQCLSNFAYELKIEIDEHHDGTHMIMIITPEKVITSHPCEKATRYYYE